MNINARTRAAFGMACALLLGATVVAAAQEDPLERQREAAEKRYEMAKESCKRLQGEDKEQCKKKAEDTYSREVESLQIQQDEPPKNMGTIPGGEDPDGIGTGQDME